MTRANPAVKLEVQPTSDYAFRSFGVTPDQVRELLTGAPFKTRYIAEVPPLQIARPRSAPDLEWKLIWQAPGPHTTLRPVVAEVRPFIAAFSPQPETLLYGLGMELETPHHINKSLTFWGTALPELPIVTAWRALALFEHLPRLFPCSLSSCWEAMAETVPSSNQRDPLYGTRVCDAKLAFLFGGKANYAKLREQIANQTPSDNDVAAIRANAAQPMASGRSIDLR